MRKLLTTALVTVAVLAIGPAAAATVTVRITASGFTPKTVSIKTGDAVTYTNGDTVAHQVVLKQTAGVQCAQPLTIQPGQSASCTFTRAGKYDYSDPTRQGGAFRGTVSVLPAPLSVTLRMAPTSVVYGAKTTLTGSLSSGEAGEKVTMLAQECGASSFTPLASVTTTTGGSFTFVAQPRLNAAYEARVRNTTSAAGGVRVRPRIGLRRLAPRRFAVRVLAAQSFAGRLASFQRYSRVTGRWVLVRRVTLRAGGTTTLPIDPTTVSRATFKARVRARVRVRIVLPGSQVGACYAAGRSNVVRS